MGLFINTRLGTDTLHVNNLNSRQLTNIILRVFEIAFPQNICSHKHLIFCLSFLFEKAELRIHCWGRKNYRYVFLFPVNSKTGGITEKF